MRKSIIAFRILLNLTRSLPPELREDMRSFARRFAALPPEEQENVCRGMELIELS